MGGEGCGANDTGPCRKVSDQEDGLSHCRRPGPRAGLSLPWMSCDSACVRKYKRREARAAPKSCLPSFEEKMAEKGAGPKEEQKEGEQRRRQPRPRWELRPQRHPCLGCSSRRWRWPRSSPPARSRAGSRGKNRRGTSRRWWAGTTDSARRRHGPGWKGCGTWTRARPGN